MIFNPLFIIYETQQKINIMNARLLSVLLSTIFLIASCQQAFIGEEKSKLDISSSQLLISFGSCNKEYMEQPLWDDIMAEDPAYFLFLGDNIYGDTENMDLLAEKYRQQNSVEGYQKLKENVQILGVWDDHDYGENDAGKEFPKKDQSQDLFLDFFNVSEDSFLRNRKGVYSAHDIEKGDLKVKILLLDTRYHRDPLESSEEGYLPNNDGSILGVEQWQWLENNLSEDSYDLFLIAGGIQFLAKDHKYEKWANFPREREKLLSLIEEKKQNVLFLSGDRHIAEMSKISLDSLEYPIYDITSSGLTHTWSNEGTEYNALREGSLIAQLNYGLLKLYEESDSIIVEAKVKGVGQKVYLSKKIKYPLN
jgi:alkaline phosphatase D